METNEIYLIVCVCVCVHLRWRGQGVATHTPLWPLVLSHHTSQEGQPAAVPELLNDQPHQPPKQRHAEDHSEQIEATCGEDHRRRTGRLKSRKEHH